MNNDTPYGQPKAPVTITKIKSDRFLDLTNLHTWIMFVAIGLCMHLFKMIALSTTGIEQLMYALLLGLVGLCFSLQISGENMLLMHSRSNLKH